jgi:predicted transcriptional regulator
MTDELDELDNLIEAQSEPEPIAVPSRHDARSEAVNNAVSGKSIKKIAKELGLTTREIKRYLREAALEDMSAIESRRILNHMKRRDLSKEKYLALASALNYLTEIERKRRNENLGIDDRVISKTTIEQINILVSRRGSENGSEEDSADYQELEQTAIPALPSGDDEGPEKSSPGDAGSGGEK